MTDGGFDGILEGGKDGNDEGNDKVQDGNYDHEKQWATSDISMMFDLRSRPGLHTNH